MKEDFGKQRGKRTHFLHHSNVCVAAPVLSGTCSICRTVFLWGGLGGSSPGEGWAGLGFPSLDCLVWGEPTGSLMLHTDWKMLIKTASQAALEGRGLEGRAECGREQPQASSQPYCAQGLLWGSLLLLIHSRKPPPALAGAFQGK